MSEASTPVVTGGEAAASVKPAASQSTQPTKTAPAEQTQPTFDPKTYKEKLKINNQEREYTLAELKQLASKGVGADEKFQKAAELDKSVKDKVEMLKSKQFTKLLEKEGMSKQEIRQYLEEQLIPFVEEEMLSPEEREKRELKRKVDEYENEKKENETKAERERREREEQVALEQELAKLDREFMSALETVSLPKQPWLGKQIAQMMQGAEKNGYYLSATEAAELVKQQYHTGLKETLEPMDIKQLKEFLGKDLLSKLRDDDVKAVKDAEKPFAKSTAKKSDVKQDNSQPSKKKLSPSFFNSLRGIKYNE